MQVILTQSVAKLGKKFEILDVSDGYAMNYLFPQGLAERATPSRMARLDAEREAARAADDAHRAEVKEKLEALAEKGIEIRAKADTSGHLYKKIHEVDIVALLKDAYGVALRKEAISLPHAIAQTGEYTVGVQESGVVVSITLSLIAA